MVDSYEKTLEVFREAVQLGFSASEVISDLENDEHTNPKALEELQYLQRHGI